MSTPARSGARPTGRGGFLSFLRVGVQCLAALLVAAALGAGLGGLVAQTRGQKRASTLENPWARQEQASPTAFVTPEGGRR